MVSYKERNKIFLGVIALLCFLASCVPQLPTSSSSSSSSGRRGSTSNSTNENNNSAPVATPAPYNTDFNFIEYSGARFFSQFVVESQFIDSIFIKGNEIQTFWIQNSGSSVSNCFVIPFAQNSVNKLLVIAGNRSQALGIGGSGISSFFRLDLSDLSRNKAACNTAGLLAQLNTLYPTYTFAFSLRDVCPACLGQLASQSMALYTPSGQALTDLSIGQLGLTISYDGTQSQFGVSCQSSADCVGEGYDCCLNQQCVINAATKFGVDTTAVDYLQALSIVQNNPASYSDYPQFFYVCPVVSTTPTPTPAVTLDPQIQAALRLQKLKDLFQCTQSRDDGIAICTKTIVDASLAVEPFPGAGSTPQTYSAENDDLNFSDINSSLPTQNILEIEYGGEIIYQVNPDNYNEVTTSINTSYATFVGSGNNNLTSGSSISLTAPVSATAISKDLKIRYQVDGTCEYINTNLIQCKKIYYYNQAATGSPLNHQQSDHDTSKIFQLPTWASTLYEVKVEIDGVIVPRNASSTWSVNTSGDVEFVSTFNFANDQKIEIQYYVANGTQPYATQLFVSKLAALNEIKTLCSCPDLNCSLSPVTQEGQTAVIDYECVYPQNNQNQVPLQTTVLVDTRSVPMRFYDSLNRSVDELDASTGPQEGTAFEYTSGNGLSPNNLSTYIGINEIYGAQGSNTDQAKPPKMIQVIKGKTYDIGANTGSFTQCPTCGSDYFSTLQKIFPQSFTDIAGGYIPQLIETSRLSNQTAFRSDDLIYGRACFLPVTMIPWTHRPNTSLSTQRMNRLNAQHFLFANGYQRDWYGFDYGSLIGSFDGTRWFAIGNARRIKADTNKLFLAVNAYFGDLTLDNAYSVTVSEVTTVAANDSAIEDDLLTDGAECQLTHICETDGDCARRLGWEYSCEDITGIRTNWPLFDSNANELVNTENSGVTLVSLIGGTGGSTKRCVYRGRGAACSPNFSTLTETTSYNSTSGASSYGHHACSENNFCAQTTSSVFNNRIARFNKGAASQNNNSTITTAIGEGDEFGLGARLLGRPLNFISSLTMPANIGTHLSHNNLQAICVPGRQTNSGNTLEVLDSTVPTVRAAARLFQIGSLSDNSGSSGAYNSKQSASYYSTCATLEDGETFLRKLYSSSKVSDSTVSSASASQNISSSLAKIIDPSNESLVFSSLTAPFKNKGIMPDICLKSAGSACHTDFECGPSNFVANKMKTFLPSEVVATTSEYELKFWQEGLVCAQDVPKNNTSYNLKNNTCCRDLGKTLTIETNQSDVRLNSCAVLSINVASQTATLSCSGVTTYVTGNDCTITSTTSINCPYLGIVINGANESFAFPNLYRRGVAGIHFDIDDLKRYSRTNAIYKDSVANIGDFPPLDVAKTLPDSSATAAQSLSALQTVGSARNKQWKTFDKLATNACCTKHWVRNFHEDNGGGHDWVQGKNQNFSKGNFACMNWTQLPAGGSYQCTDLEVESGTCPIRNFNSFQQDNYLENLGLMELLGIPQIRIPSEQNANQALICTDLNNNLNSPMPGSIKTEAQADPEYTNEFSSHDETNFSEDLKQVFSENEVSCCLPTGVFHGPTVDNQQDLCCSGTAVGGVCCLPDYTDLTVYLNRFVSSEANALDDSLFDPYTGYLKNVDQVKQLAALKSMCCSGKIGTGRAIAKFRVPGTTGGLSDDLRRKFRFVTSNGPEDNESDTGDAAEVFDQGARWNNHVYCLPQSVPDPNPDFVKE